MLAATVRTVNAILEPLLASPALPEYVRELTERVEAERRKRHEFREALRPSQKAEFINGEVVLHSPAKYRHIGALGLLQALLHAHSLRRELGVVLTEKALVEFPRNDYGPDVIFYRAEKAAEFQPEKMIFPVPGFIAEILSPSTEKNDRGVKLRDYERNGVGEYWIIDPVEHVIEQRLRGTDGFAAPLIWRKRENIEARAVAGFVIPVAAIFEAEENLRALVRLAA